MNKSSGKTLAILKQEFHLQFITACMVIIFFMLSFTFCRIISPIEDELPKMFIIFYAMGIGLVLPWQLNTAGHIELGYCRYHLSLPVKTWKLSILPLLFRIFLVLVFLCIEFLFHEIYYANSDGRYLTVEDMIYFFKLSLLIYLSLQTYAWSKESFRNLMQLITIAVVSCIITWPAIADKMLEWPYYLTIISGLIVLAVTGVRNMRMGNLFVFPGIQDLFTYQVIKRKYIIPTRKFKNGAVAQMRFEWKRTWYFMPLLTLIFIALVGYFDLNTRWQRLENIIVSLGVIYGFICLAVPLFGMIFIENVGFKSTFVNHLPVRTGKLVSVKLKCFALSYAICMLLFFLWVIIRIFFIDKSLVIQIYLRNTIFLESPGVIIWTMSALIIWAFILAFFVVTSYLNYRLLSIIIVTATVMLYLYQYNVFGVYKYATSSRFGSPVEYDQFPLYMPLALMFFVMVAVKTGMLALQRSKLYYVAIYVALALASGVLFVLAANSYVLISVLAAVLVFIYPYWAKEIKLCLDRYEIDNKFCAIPWRLVTVVFAVLALFAGYTYAYNKYQINEINSMFKECSEFNPPKLKTRTKISLRNFLKKRVRNFASFEKNYKKYFEEQKKEGNWNYKQYRLWPYHVLEFTEKHISILIKQKKYKQAIEFLILQYEVEYGYAGVYGIKHNKAYLLYILFNSPSPGDLEKLYEVQKKVLVQRLIYSSVHTENCLKRLKKKDPANAFYHSKYMRKRTESKYNDFMKLYLSPFLLNCNLDTITTIRNYIKTIDYCLGDDITNVESFRFNTSKLDSFVEGQSFFHSFLYVQKDMTAVAIARYKAEYLRYPERIQELVPRFLTPRELLVYNTPDIYYYIGKSLDDTLGHLIPNSMKMMDAYMEIWSDGDYAQKR